MEDDGKVNDDDENKDDSAVGDDYTVTSDLVGNVKYVTDTEGPRLSQGHCR